MLPHAPTFMKSRWTRGKLRHFLAGATLLAAVSGVHAESLPAKIKQGNQRFDQKMYEQALQLYSEALQQQPDRREVNYNLANTLYRMDKHREAATEMKKALGTEDAALRRKATYNLGNALYRAGQFQEAADQYTQALQLDPGDRDAKVNLELALKKLEQQQKQQSKNQDQDKDQDKDKDKDKDKDQQDASGQQDQTKQNQEQSKENQQQSKPDKQQSQDQQQSGKDESRKAEDTSPPKDPKGLSRQDAERLLQAMEAKEREELTRQLQKVRRGVVRGRDW